MHPGRFAVHRGRLAVHEGRFDNGVGGGPEGRGAPSLSAVEILWWLAPGAGATLCAMLWATWAGRPRRDDRERSEADHERFAAAMARKHPAAGRPLPPAVRDRSTGIAVRPSRRG